MLADESTAECLVFTYKEGLLSPIAHDLRIRVSRFVIEADADRVRARFDAASLRVECALRDGAEHPLSERDRRQIEHHIADGVLKARRWPEIRFDSRAVTEEGASGTLTLCGVERPLGVPMRREDGRRVCEVRLHQPDFGIRPFRAMLGTLKVKPDVLVRLTV